MKSEISNPDKTSNARVSAHILAAFLNTLKNDLIGVMNLKHQCVYSTETCLTGSDTVTLRRSHHQKTAAGPHFHRVHPSDLSQTCWTASALLPLLSTDSL